MSAGARGTGAADFVAGMIAGTLLWHNPLKVTRLEVVGEGRELKMTLASGVVVHVVVSEDRALATD